jgi:CRISPR-associated protein Csh1
MLDTLKKIGDQLLEGQGVWARLVTEPKHNPDKKNWVCPILFDCIDQEIRFLKDKMVLFNKENTPAKFRYVSPSIWGPRGKKCALTVEPKNFSMLVETLFGKKDGDKGSMMDSILDFNPELENKSIYHALQEINSYLPAQRSRLELKSFKEELDFGSNEDVVLFYSLIRSESFNNGEPTALFDLEGYEEFIIGKFATPENVEKGVDYITGNTSDEVIEATFSGRYNIHKIFQTTASNYASGFSDFKKNFQSNPATLASLDKASDYVLNNLNTRIAGVNHIVLPNYLHKNLKDFDLDQIKLFLDKTGDFLFQYQTLDTELDKHLPELDLFWVNYIAFESDGNSFKILNHIKDVNSAYLKKLVEVFGRTDFEFRSYLGDRAYFNLQSIYRIIPVRDGQKSKINPVLNLFKEILEQKPVHQEVLFDHFITLALCHWYGRHRAFPNVNQKFKSFDFAIKDAVFKYSALVYALKQLNLIDMATENRQEETNETVKNEFQQRVDDFFQKMEYSEAEKAMFYLGNVLSAVATAQYNKNHKSKPILNKINFNGMDAQSILRLSLDLNEKANQYKILSKAEWNLALFRERFNGKNWPLTKEQNVFYLMAGYSFGLTKPDNQ